MYVLADPVGPRLTMSVTHPPRAPCRFYHYKLLPSNHVLQDSYVGTLRVAFVLAASDRTKRKQRFKTGIAKALYILDNDVPKLLPTFFVIPLSLAA